jgi:hypothetical protein
MSQTTDKNKIAILADLWINYRNDQNFEDFIAYNDLGLPLAYLLNEGIVNRTDRALAFINETFELLLAGLELKDTGWTDLDEMLAVEE